MEFYTSAHRQGNYILLRGYNNGQHVIEKHWFEPTLYVQRPDSNQVANAHSTLDGTKVTPVKFGSMKEASDYVKQYENIPGIRIEGNTNYVSQFLTERYPGNIAYDGKMINTAVIDIEVAYDNGYSSVEDAANEIISIAFKNNQENAFHVWGLRPYDTANTLVDTPVNYYHCDSESELLKSFLAYWSDPYNTPDIITGWNSKLFDMVYIINRITNVLGEKATKKLSPWGIINYKPVRDNFGSKEKQAYQILGVSQLDYLDLFKKFAHNYGTQETYKLDHIGNVVLGEKKLDYSEHGTLHGLYNADHQKFIDYNIKDTELVERMDDKIGLIALAQTISFKTTSTFEQVFGTIGMWDSYIYKTLNERGITIPQNARATKSDFGGGYVKDPIPGHKDWVVSFDLNSLYPHLIMQYNMSPETVMDERIPGINPDSILEGASNPKPEYAMSGTGQLFSKEKKGFIPEMVEKLYAERKDIKIDMLRAEQELVDLPDNASAEERYGIEKRIATFHNQQRAIKILMNALYGAMANVYFRYYDIRIADSITTSGRLTIRWAEKYVNAYLNKVLKTDNADYVIAIDTDSVYVSFDAFVKSVGLTDTAKIVAFLDKICASHFEPMLEGAYQDLADTLSAYANKMVMAREVIADRGIWTAKKRYILNVWNSEGVAYDKAKLKIMGIEAIKSSTPQLCRNKFKEVFPILINGTPEEMRKFVNDFKEEFKSAPIEAISAPRGTNNIGKYKSNVPGEIYVKGTPLHIRGVTLFNHYVKAKGLSHKYVDINDGDKIKYVYLKLPNPIKENVISFNDAWPKELGLEEYIDYDTQFNKVFLDSLTLILNAIGWELKPKQTLDSFFG